MKKNGYSDVTQLGSIVSFHEKYTFRAPIWKIVHWNFDICTVKCTVRFENVQKKIKNSVNKINRILKKIAKNFRLASLGERCKFKSLLPRMWGRMWFLRYLLHCATIISRLHIVHMPFFANFTSNNSKKWATVACKRANWKVTERARFQFIISMHSRLI